MKWLARIAALGALVLAVAAIATTVDMSLDDGSASREPPTYRPPRTLGTLGLGTSRSLVKRSLGDGKPAGRAVSRRRGADCFRYESFRALERYELCFRRGRLVSSELQVEPGD